MIKNVRIRNIEIEMDCYSLISDYDRTAKMTQGSERSCFLLITGEQALEEN